MVKFNHFYNLKPFGNTNSSKPALICNKINFIDLKKERKKKRKEKKILSG